jgi:uncharacterized cupredoxin-like copper-binding protein
MTSLPATLLIGLLIGGTTQNAAATQEANKAAQANPMARVVFVKLDDISNDHSEIKVSQGETVRFVVKNEGSYLHEFNIGTAVEQLEHQREMVGLFKSGILTPTGFSDKIVWRERSGMGDSNPPGIPEVIRATHTDANAIMIEPGTTKELVWTFNQQGALDFACTLPGHYQAGERGRFAGV